MVEWGNISNIGRPETHLLGGYIEYFIASAWANHTPHIQTNPICGFLLRTLSVQYSTLLSLRELLNGVPMWTYPLRIKYVTYSERRLE